MTGATPAQETRTRSVGLTPIIEGPLALAAAITAVLASTVGLLYVIGGTVMWLRFHEAGLPADRAVALVPKDDLLILGLRVMVMPALLSGGFLLVLGSIWRAREIRLGELVREKEEQEQLADTAADAEDPAIRKRVAKLEEDILRGQKPLLTADRLPRLRTNPVRFVVLIALAIGLVLVVPFSIGSLAWPVVLVGLLGYWLHLRPESLTTSRNRFPIWRLALAAVIGAATISIARQTDRPVELLSVRAEVKNPSALVLQTLELHNGRRDGRRIVGGDVSGILVAITGREIAIGDPTHRVIASLPRSSVTSLTIGPPLDQRAPPTSLLSRLLHGSGWAVTPLELWCGNLRYGWSRIGHACQLAPRIKAGERLTISKESIRGVKVSCPGAAEEGCRGFILIVTQKPVALGSTGLRVSVPAQSFAIDPGQTQSVLVPVNEAGLYKQLANQGDGDVRVGVRVRLSMEAAGKAVVKRTTSELLVAAPAAAKKTHAGKKHKKKPTTTQNNGGGANNTPTKPAPAGKTPQPGHSRPTPSTTSAPGPAASPEPTPSNSDPLPPQEETVPAPTPDVQPTP